MTGLPPQSSSCHSAVSYSCTEATVVGQPVDSWHNQLDSTYCLCVWTMDWSILDLLRVCKTTWGPGRLSTTSSISRASNVACLKMETKRVLFRSFWNDEIGCCWPNSDARYGQQAPYAPYAYAATPDQSGTDVLWRITLTYRRSTDTLQMIQDQDRSSSVITIWTDKIIVII
jgi:hypothetical protein